jgi:hypothetical protein
MEDHLPPKRQPKYGSAMKKSFPQFSEKLTRKQLIDGQLTEAGWRIVSAGDFDASKPLHAYDRCENSFRPFGRPMLPSRPAYVLSRATFLSP